MLRGSGGGACRSLVPSPEEPPRHGPARRLPLDSPHGFLPPPRRARHDFRSRPGRSPARRGQGDPAAPVHRGRLGHGAPHGNSPRGEPRCHDGGRGEELEIVMSRAVAAEEALKLVPGVKVDNQANQERVHLSIRGQGKLTERGIRGIKVLLDGLPLNDPTGFAPDLFDVDWASVGRVEVFRGPASALCGGGASRGSSTSRPATEAPGRPTPASAPDRTALEGVRRYDGGTEQPRRVRVSASRNEGGRLAGAHRLRRHQPLRQGPPVRRRARPVTAIVAGTEYFNENPEGLNVAQVEGAPRPNPDALTYDEYQKTRRAIVGPVGPD